MTKEEAVKVIEWYRIHPYEAHAETCEYNNEALDMAIDALSKPNYESDTEVRLAVTDRNKDKVVLWDAFGEVEYYPNGEINCVHCPHYHETEDDTGVHSHCGSHGRLIDADTLSKKLCETTIFIKDGEVFQRMINDAPTVSAEAVQGEWTYLSGSKGSYMTISCPICGSTFNGVPEWKYHYCPNCGAWMKGGGDK